MSIVFIDQWCDFLSFWDRYWRRFMVTCTQFESRTQRFKNSKNVFITPPNKRTQPLTLSTSSLFSANSSSYFSVICESRVSADSNFMIFSCCSESECSSTFFSSDMLFSSSRICLIWRHKWLEEELCKDRSIFTRYLGRVMGKSLRPLLVEKKVLTFRKKNS